MLFGSRSCIMYKRSCKKTVGYWYTNVLIWHVPKNLGKKSFRFRNLELKDRIAKSKRSCTKYIMCASDQSIGLLTETFFIFFIRNLWTFSIFENEL